MNEHKLVEIFVSCDDFYKEFEKFLSDKGLDDDPLKKTLVFKLPDVSKRGYDGRHFLPLIWL